MDPITIILAALAPGAAKAAGELVPDAYKALKALLQKRFTGQPAATMVLEAYEKDPETYSAPLKKTLEEAGVDKDEEIIHLLEQLKPQMPAGARVTTIGQGAKGIIGQTVSNVTFTGNIS